MTFETFADQLNADYANGVKMTVNGRTVHSYGKEAAKIWQNGTLSVDVRTKKGNGVTQLWTKVGQPLPEVVREQHPLHDLWAEAVAAGTLKEMPKL